MRFNIVKQSDVSHGTALHYALSWTYGRKALCGKEMRSTARDGEIGYKRVCGSCARIMAKNVETDHAQALEFNAQWDASFTATECPVEGCGKAETSTVSNGQQNAPRVISDDCGHEVFHVRCADCEYAVEEAHGEAAAEDERRNMSDCHDTPGCTGTNQHPGSCRVLAAQWNPHMIKGVTVEGVNGSAQAEVLGTVTHDFAGVGIMVRYEDYSEPIFLGERVLRGCPDYVAV